MSRFLWFTVYILKLSQSTHPFRTYDVFTADALYYAMTLIMTFDLERL